MAPANLESSFDQQSPERTEILGEAPHIQVLESVARNLRKYGASEEEVTAYLAPYKETLGDYYEKIVAQTKLLEGAAQDLAILKLNRESAQAADMEGNAMKLQNLEREYRSDLAAMMTGGAEAVAA